MVNLSKLRFIFALPLIHCDYKVGKCPKLEHTWDHLHEEPLDHKRILGYWQVAYMNELDNMWMECNAMKLVQVGDDPRQMQVVNAGVAQPEPELEVLVEDHQALVFKHHNDTSAAYLTGVHDNGETDAVSTLAKYDQKLLKKLRKDEKVKMTEFDKGLYKAKRREQLISREILKQVLRDGDRFKFPLRVIETDYDRYMITHQCHEEYRRPRQSDDLTLYWENYRLSTEEGKERTSAEMATFVKEQLTKDKRFQHFQALLIDSVSQEKEENRDASGKKLQQELDKFVKFPINIGHVFKGLNPSIDLWREMRPYYAIYLGDEEEEQADPKKKQWFNRPIMTLYVRNSSSTTAAEMKEYLETVFDALPGNNFEMTHLKVEQYNHKLDQSFCPTNIPDLFKSDRVTSFLSLLNPSVEKFKEAEEAAKQLREALKKPHQDDEDDDHHADEDGYADEEDDHDDDDDNEDEEYDPDGADQQDPNDADEDEEPDDDAKMSDIQREDVMNDLYDAADDQDEADDKSAGYKIFENEEGLERADHDQAQETADHNDEGEHEAEEAQNQNQDHDEL